MFAAIARVRAGLGLSDAVVVGWTGILREWHGIDLLLKAIAGVPDVAVLLVGDGPEMATAQAGPVAAATKVPEVRSTPVPEAMRAPAAIKARVSSKKA